MTEGKPRNPYWRFHEAVGNVVEPVGKPLRFGGQVIYQMFHREPMGSDAVDGFILAGVPLLIIEGMAAWIGIATGMKTHNDLWYGLAAPAGLTTGFLGVWGIASFTGSVVDAAKGFREVEENRKERIREIRAGRR